MIKGCLPCTIASQDRNDLTFFKIINKSEYLGIPRAKLHEVFQCYLKICIPEKKGMISSDPRALITNVEKLTKVLNIDTEITKLQDMLKKVSRSPGQKLETIEDKIGRAHV